MDLVQFVGVLTLFNIIIFADGGEGENRPVLGKFHENNCFILLTPIF